MSEYLTAEQVADAIGVTRRTVYDWLRTGKLKGKKIGGKWLIKRIDLP